MVSAGTGVGNIPYHRFGAGDQSLVFLPGVMDALGWNTPSRLTAELLARYYFRDFRDYDVWVLSRPPGLPPDVGLDWMADRYAPVLAELDTAHVLGFTLGGAVGLRLARMYPSLVDRLVLVACGTVLGTDGRDTLSTWTSLARTGQWTALHIEYARTMYDGAHERIVPLLYRLGKPFLPQPVDGGDVVSSCETLFEFDARGSAESIDTPTLVVGDTAGPLFKLDHQQDLAARVENGHIATITGGHAVYEESPRQFASVVNRFLAGQHTH